MIQPGLQDRGREERTFARRMLAALRDGADFRRRKVRRLRAAIRARRYENRLKLEVASDRLADDLLGAPTHDVPSR